MKLLPRVCPACDEDLQVKRLRCPTCETEVEGAFGLPGLARLPVEDQAFIWEFVKASGSLKAMAKLLGLSYPTVRNRLDDIIIRIKNADTQRNTLDHSVDERSDKTHE